MRVVLTAFDSRGGVEPLVGLAAALRARGAEVRVCVPPDEEFAGRLARVGVPVVPIGWDVRALLTGATPPSVADVPRRGAQLIDDAFDTVAGEAEGGDVVVASGLVPSAAGAASVAELLGLRYVYVSYQPVSLPSPHHPPQGRPGHPLPAGVTDRRALWEDDARAVDALFGEALTARREGVGLPPVASLRDHAFTERPWLAADPVLAPWPGEPGEPVRPLPSDPAVVQTGAWFAPDAGPLDAGLEAFLAAGPPPVYVGFGSMPVGPGAARAAVDAARTHGRRVLLARGWADLAPVDDGDDCAAVGDVDHTVLFPRVAAVVHHGGAGTTTAATRAGVPQVVVPQQTVDQTYFAGRVAALGVGVAHDGPTPSTGSLSVALGEVLTPGVATRARAVAATIRTDGAARAAALLFDGAGHGPVSA